jgi:hypothetical protein
MMSTGSAISPVFPLARDIAENASAHSRAVRREGPRKNACSARNVHGRIAIEQTSGKCSNPAAWVSREGESRKSAPPIPAVQSSPAKAFRNWNIPTAPTPMRNRSASLGPAKKPRGTLNAHITAFETISDQDEARLVPCKNIGDHHGRPPTLSAADKKSRALAKLARSS